MPLWLPAGGGGHERRDGNQNKPGESESGRGAASLRPLSLVSTHLPGARGSR